MVDDSDCCVPDFGCVVERTHLLVTARAQRPPMIVVCAPPGCGKSVLAAQIATDHGRFDFACWVPMYDSDVRSGEWLAQVAKSLECRVNGESADDNATIPLSPTHQDSDAHLRVAEVLGTHSGKAVALIVDGISRVGSITEFEDMANLLVRSTSPASCLILTCRYIVGSMRTPMSSRAWLVDEKDLHFDAAEVLQLAVAAGVDEADISSRAETLMMRFGGHPALTSLMLRHRCVDDSVSPPGDLVWYTQRLVDQQPDGLIPSLYCASLLREGRASELEECLQRARSVSVDWRLLQAVAPLLAVLQPAGDAPSAFRVHAVLNDVLKRSGPERLGEEAAADMRDSVVGYLLYTGDYVRAHGVLVGECTPTEVADWCESHGSGLLRCVGPSAVERCLARVSPSRLASSTRLLLLRAAALREYERVEEAAANATLACRIAEIDANREDQLTAMLLVARLALDNADLFRARTALEQLGGILGPVGDEAVSCVYHAYRALLAAYECRPTELSLHANSAVDLLSDVDEGSQEAVMAANCIAGIEGLVRGRWDRASALCARVSSWPKLPPLQALVSRANTAACYLETGSPAESILAVTHVLEEARTAGLKTLEAYALDTWAQASWFEDQTASDAAFDRSQQMLAAHGDAVAVASTLSLRSLLVRSAGLYEESLALAESAATAVREKGACMRVVVLQAQVETAASLQSLGDRWGAKRLIDEIQSEIVGIGAEGLSLCADLILAEGERQAGAIAQACDRLAPHGKYILTGAANLRLAMYIQAFPGLLQVLARSIGVKVLPLKMLRLVNRNVVEAALAAPEAPESLSPEDRLVISLRAFGGTESVERAQHEDASRAKDTCFVRVFGGLRVETSAGVVAEEYWRKRKARLVFAMLIVRQGQDLPRDVVIERLWPDMDQDRALRNFYVTWSAMKKALACGGSSDVGGRLVQCVGGLCRLRREVRSDLDDFDDAVGRLRLAREVGDQAAVLESANRLLALYRGDLLPGDLYDEWFSEARERVRQDFCDALIAAAQVAENSQQLDTAISMLRRVSLADPWREDAYQASMRCQMRAGQRSRAIETYLTCRSKLVDDLGIDPSIETTRIYQAVLAMESEAPA